MANYGTDTCFRLDWPEAACRTLQEAVECVAHRLPVDDLPVETRRVVLRLLDDYDTLGADIWSSAHHGEGVVVRDDDGMFAPHGMADLISAVMRDHRLSRPVSFTWAETCDKHRVGAFSGGGAVVSAEHVRLLRIEDWLEAARADLAAAEETAPSPAPAP